MTYPSRKDYPRPDFERFILNWESLNGLWDFLFDDGDVGLSEGWHCKGLPNHSVAPTPFNSSNPKAIVDAKRHEKCEIKVPFVFQTPASGLNEKGAHEVIWYERKISDLRTSEEKKTGHRLLVRFGAVDYEAAIWVDGSLFGSHLGGHVPFDVDVTDAFQFPIGSGTPNGRLTIRVRDSPYDLKQPRGKQYWDAQPEKIWYTPSSGIWQSVWLESVPATRIADSSHGTILRSNDVDEGTLHSRIAILGKRAGQCYNAEIEASLGGNLIGKSKADIPKELTHVDIDLKLRVQQQKLHNLPILETFPLDNKFCWSDGLALWSPEYPLLYDLTIRLYDSSEKLVDEVCTTTGMRSLDWKKGDGTFRLNGKPYFQALVLDQGYWPESNLTPPSPQKLKEDIELSKKMGFNGCRKHQKVEDPVFFYWADRLGYIVWGEMANAYQFDEEYVERFNQEWMEAVKRDINHPSIFTWTPGNESWGYPSLQESVEQRNHLRSLYFMTKTLDPTRSINDNCGWEHVITDITTFHDYTEASVLTKTCETIRGVLQKKSNREIFVYPIYNPQKPDNGSMHTQGAPVICTECGGINIAPKDHQGGEKDWGYTTAADPQDLLGRLENLFTGIVKGGLCCGFVYTQLTDIEQEVNGLYSYDRREKLSAEKVKAIIDAAQKLYYDGFKKGDPTFLAE